MSVDRQNPKDSATINTIQESDNGSTTETSHAVGPLTGNSTLGTNPNTSNDSSSPPKVDENNHYFDDLSKWSGRTGNGLRLYNEINQVTEAKEILGNFEQARLIINPETYSQRMEFIKNSNWTELGEVMTPGTTSKQIAENLAIWSSKLDTIGHVFTGAAITGDTVSEYMERNGVKSAFDSCGKD